MVPSSFCAASHSGKGTFYKHAVQERALSLHGVVPVSRQVLCGLLCQLDFPTSGAGDALAG